MLLEPSATEQSEAERLDTEIDVIEYRKQLILTSLLNICHKLNHLGIAKDVLTPDKFNVCCNFHKILTLKNITINNMCTYC